jgi:hypothetical protein
LKYQPFATTKVFRNVNKNARAYFAEARAFRGAKPALRQMLLGSVERVPQSRGSVFATLDA